MRMFVVLSASTGLWAGSFDEASGEDDAVVGVSVMAVALARSWNFVAAVDQSSDEQTSHMRSLARNFAKKAGTRIVGFIEYPIQLVARLRDPHPSPPGFASDIIRALAGQTVLIKAPYSNDEVASVVGEVTTRWSQEGAVPAAFARLTQGLAASVALGGAGVLHAVALTRKVNRQR